MGCIYALAAVGLALIWGLMEIVNFAHGDFLMLAMYTTFWLWALYRIDPLFSLPVAVMVVFGLGVLTYRGIIKRVLNAPMVAQIFATFGLGLALRSGAQFLWTPNYRMIQNPLAGGVMSFFGVAMGVPQVVAGVVAIILTVALYLYISRSETGRALMATSEDRETAELMAIDTHRMFTVGWGIGSACVGAAGALLSMYYYIYPEVGLMFGLLAYVAVALGGFGSIQGALLAALVIGVVQVTSSFFLSPAYKMAFVYLLYLVVVIARPRGLLGRW